MPMMRFVALYTNQEQRTFFNSPSMNVNEQKEEESIIAKPRKL